MRRIQRSLHGASRCLLLVLQRKGRRRALLTARRLTGYRLRQWNQAPNVLAAVKPIGFEVLAAGDSLNDTGLLHDADAGAFVDARASARAAAPTPPAYDHFSSPLAFFGSSADRLESRESDTIEG